ncbi:MAG: hypothetical protein DRI30_08235, partial [Chloroflexi bacterium]
SFTFSDFAALVIDPGNTPPLVDSLAVTGYTSPGLTPKGYEACIFDDQGDAFKAYVLFHLPNAFPNAVPMTDTGVGCNFDGGVPKGTIHHVDTPLEAVRPDGVHVQVYAVEVGLPENFTIHGYQGSKTIWITPDNNQDNVVDASFNPDVDGNGILDLFEFREWGGTGAAPPYLPDSDGDLIPDPYSWPGMGLVCSRCDHTPQPGDVPVVDVWGILPALMHMEVGQTTIFAHHASLSGEPRIIHANIFEGDHAMGHRGVFTDSVYQANLPGKALIFSSFDPATEAATVFIADSIAPGPITDLTATPTDSDSIRLAWTATGDGRDNGEARNYELRHSPTARLETFKARSPRRCRAA